MPARSKATARSKAGARTTDTTRSRAGARSSAARSTGTTRSTAPRSTAAARRAWAPPVLTADRPHVRLGLAWAVVTMAAAMAGTLVLAGWLAVVAGVAGLQAARGAKAASARRGRRAAAAPERLGVVVGAVLPPVAATLGPLGAVLGVVLAGTGAWLRGATVGAPGRTLATGLPWGVAAAAPVVMRTLGLAEAVTLLGLVWAFDAGCYVVGVGAGHRWEGTVAGVAGMATVTLGAAAVFVPPFDGATPWVLGGVAAVLAPLGPRFGSALLGKPDADVPAARRLDSLLLAGPALAALAVVLLPGT